MPIAAYCRVSSVSQIDRDGLTRQKDAISAWSMRTNRPIDKWFTDNGVSGTKPMEDRSGMQAMILAGKILALLDERYNVAFDDIRAAAKPALRHRIILNFEAQAEGISPDAVIEDILQSIVVEA